MKHAAHNARGIITLLSLLLIATVTMLAVTASVIIVNELRQTETIGQGIVSVYAAEAGMEDGLYSVKNDRASGVPLQGLSSAMSHLTVATPTPLGSASWLRKATLEDTFTVTRLERDQTATLDFYDPDGLGGSNIQSIEVTASDDCNGHSQLEITMFEFDSSNFDFSNQSVYKLAETCQPFGTVCDFNDSTGKNSNTGNVGLVTNTIGFHKIFPNKNYRFLFRELVPQGTSILCSIENLSVTGYSGLDASGAIVPIPAHIVITSTGSFGSTKQAMTASVPWKAPVSGLTNFVLFSEESIIKD